ncbi:MAG: DUF4386 domain-containing protein [Haliscomenobacteraceae bacterium CHB4]|nr:DUF4386 domain-containing protein [Haliscomenobacteraceae bacterium CHB4]
MEININQKTARTAGILYLTIIAAGIFAEFFVRSSLIVSGDAAATAKNIVASESLFRIGIASDTLMIICDVALALVFYVLLKPVNSSLSLMAAFFRLTQAAVLGVNLLMLFFVLQLLNGGEYLAVFGAEQLYALSMIFLEAHGIGYSIGLVFFGVHCFILGYLIAKSGYFPRILGILLMVASLGYLTDSFAKILMSNYKTYETTFALIVFAPAFIAELSMCLWLLLKGVKIPETKS